MSYDDIIRFAPLAIYAQNRDLTEEMPGIVRRAQKYVVSRLDHDAFMTDLGDHPVAITGIVDESLLPVELLEVRSIAIKLPNGNYLPLLPRNLEMLTMLYADGRRGWPRYYAQDPAGGHRVFPPPSLATPARIRGNVEPPVLSPDQPTNLISDEFPLLLQLAATREAAVFMADAAMQALYEGEAGDALAAANAQVGRRTRDEAAQRPTDTRNAQGS
jgi:hypothetical protein